MEFETGDVILCTVDRIVGTSVFLKIDGTDKEASMTFSEVSPGRIRNIRDFVVPKKKIACKVLKIKGDLIEVSLRRVSQKETKEVMEQHKLEKSYEAILKSILKDKTQGILTKIREKHRLYDILEESKEDPKDLEKIVGKENSKKILDILVNQKKKTTILKKDIELSTDRPDGLTIIKNILGKKDDAEIRYVAAGKYSIKVEDETTKKAGQRINEIFLDIEKEAKDKGIEIKTKQ